MLFDRLLESKQMLMTGTQKTRSLPALKLDSRYSSTNLVTSESERGWDLGSRVVREIDSYLSRADVHCAPNRMGAYGCGLHGE